MKKFLTILAIVMMALIAKAEDVSTASELKTAIDSNNDVTLTQDIDISNLSAISSGDQEGYLFGTYTGTLNGNGHTLKNSSHPLFYRTSGAKIQNITLDGFTIVGATSVIARTSANSTFSYITVKNSSLAENNAGSHVGMIAGYSSSDTFTYCTVAPGCSVTAKHGDVGGIAGYTEGDNGFSYCFNGASVSASGHYNIGGIVGFHKSSQLSHCINTGYIKGKNDVGGICGAALRKGLTIEYCVNTSDIECNPGWLTSNEGGGIAGVLYKETNLNYCMTFGRSERSSNGDLFYGYKEVVDITEKKCYYYYYYKNNSYSNLSDMGTSYAAMMSGEFACSSGWLYQDIDNNTFGTHYPSPIPTAGQVYKNVLCDGTVTYSNKHYSTRSHTTLEQNGYCTTCGLRIAHINDADGLVSFANELNSGNKFAYAKVTLDSDIDLSGRTDFTGIGSADGAYTFKGTFDGQGHRIKNWNYTFTGGNGHGFFRRLTGACTVIRNLIIDSSCSITAPTNAYYGTGGVIGFVTGTQGAVCNVTIENCGNEAAITGYGTVSGILGAVYNNTNTSLNISNCYNTGAIKASKDASAISASLDCTRTITNCYNSGTVSGVSDKHYFYDNSNGSGTVSNCYDVNYAQTGVSRISAIQVSDGELCNLLNKTATVFSQDIKTDAYPTPGAEGLTNAEVLHIANATDMATFAANVNAGNTYGATIVYLDDDIDLSTVSAISSGDGKGYLFLTFGGTFEGNGHTLKNSSHGLFRHTSSATIENVILDGFAVTDQTSLIACTSSYSTFSNIMVKNSSLKHTSDDTNNFGMIVGWSNYDNIRYCSVESDCSVTANRQRTGGLVGESFRGKISYCRNSATITGDADDIGGIVGKSGDSDDGAASNIEYCVNTGTIKGDDQCGGIVGYYREGTITNCVNTGTITSKDGDNHDNQGGIAGKISNAACNNSINFGSVVKCKSANSQFAIYGGKDGSWSATGNEYYCTVYGKHFDTGIAYDDLMMGKYAVSKGWLYQDIDNGTFTATSYPVPVSEAGTVYANVLCEGTLSYSNKYESTEAHDSQLDGNGVCTVCGAHIMHITNAAGLVALANDVNAGADYSKYIIYLDNDINLTGLDYKTGSTFIPVGNSEAHPFKGIFDGQGHCINNLKTYSADSNYGLFGVVSGFNTVIKNVIISEGTDGTNHSVIQSESGVTTYGVAGIIGSVSSASCGECNVTIENCGNEAQIYGTYNVAGILGRVMDDNCQITINNCYNTAYISGSESGSICGYAGNNYTISNCYNKDSNDGLLLYRAGGNVSSTSSVTNCYDVNPSTSSGQVQTGVTQITADQVTSGALCLLLNGTSTVFTQIVNVNPYPVPGTDGLRDVEEIHIANASELAQLASKVNGGVDYSNSTVYLDNDIDLSQLSFTPIGSTEYPFKGIFDGQGHRIKNLVLKVDANYVGLFGCVSGDSTVIKNLVIDSSCSITQDYKDKDYKAVAGLVGGIYSASGSTCKVIIMNCGNEAAIKGYKNVAGILGGVYNNDNTVLNILNCYNIGVVHGLEVSSAICALTGKKTTIVNCFNTADIVGAASNMYFAYYVNSDDYTIENCYFSYGQQTGATKLTTIQMQQGYLCLALNSYCSENPEWTAWTQDIATDAIPGFGNGGCHYTRTMSNQWGTICLPFDVDADDNDDFDFYELSGVSGDALSLTKVEGTLAAGTPAIIRRNASVTDINITACDSTFVLFPVKGSTANGLTLTGYFSSSDVSNLSGYIIANNAFWRIKDLVYESDGTRKKDSNGNYIRVYCSPYRAFLAGNLSGAKMLSIGFGDATSLNDVLGSLNDSDKEIYDINGARIENLQKGINIVKFSNGATKKIILK